MAQTLSFSTTFDILDEIRTFVGEQAREAGFDARDIYSIQLATDEAASNVIEHAYGGRSDGRFEVSCAFQTGRLIITLLDHGKAFDPSQVEDPDLKAPLLDRKIGGLGIYLMRKLMDEVRYESTQAGNLLTLVKRKG
ncbi:MAG TPA: ATP-binding protein [Anaerolineales bacterium]|nr:ATP-binding protein [Anaerolineales bacterium]